MLTLLEIQRMSSEDGPGLRTTAFFKGCPLRCAWCHNPESIKGKGEVVWHASRCIVCGSCVAACPKQGISWRQTAAAATTTPPTFDAAPAPATTPVATTTPFEQTSAPTTTPTIAINRQACLACFTCSTICPTGAIEGKGKQLTAFELCHELLKDQAYWGSDGGVTLSGGEALAQSELPKLAELLKQNGVQVALDTCGLVPPARLLATLEHCAIVLYDLKLADACAHERLTGATNKQIIENLQLVFDWVAKDKGRKLWIRTPVIPGMTDSAENIAALGSLLASRSGVNQLVERWELMAFNNLCVSKYLSLDEDWQLAGMPLPTAGQMAKLQTIAKLASGIQAVYVTGATR